MSTGSAVIWVLAVGVPSATSIVSALHWSLKRILGPHMAMHEAMVKDIKDLKRTVKRSDQRMDRRLGRIETSLKIGD